MDLFNLLFRLDFNTPEEKKLVDEVFTNAMMVLSEEDRGLVAPEGCAQVGRL